MRRVRYCGFLGSLCAALNAFAGSGDAGGDSLGELSRMTLEQLANVEVTSVSKSAQSLSTAPASIYVITRDEILRSGALSIPDALRLAPNLQIAQTGAADYQIGARGFGGNIEAQNFSNKILILIDGRSVYNPLFSGVTYDALDVFMDDVDRIEVISGPGATLWGSNAMNGVINIITRRAGESTGTLLRATAGNQESALAGRYGHAFDGGAFRVYAKAFDRGPSELEDGASAGDRWHKAQGGFRTDFARGANGFTVQGDAQFTTLGMGAAPDVDFTQFNVLGRWEHTGERADTRLQVFFDRTVRDRPPLQRLRHRESADLLPRACIPGAGSHQRLCTGHDPPQRSLRADGGHQVRGQLLFRVGDLARPAPLLDANRHHARLGSGVARGALPDAARCRRA
jgi:iron complex outermembrane receptor protein